MKPETAELLRMVAGLAQRVPGAAEVIGQNVRAMRSLVKDFRDQHDGAEPDMHVTTRVRIPRAKSGIVALGPLVRITYLSVRGDELAERTHDFEGGDSALPILSYAHDGSGLIVVRGNSAYTVTKRGIEG